MSREVIRIVFDMSAACPVAETTIARAYLGSAVLRRRKITGFEQVRNRSTTGPYLDRDQVCQDLRDFVSSLSKKDP
jgi:hypothetical protein